MNKKMKILTGCFLAFAGLCFALPLAKEGISYVTKATVPSVSVDADDIVITTTGSTRRDVFYFYLEENDLTIAAGGSRYTATAENAVVSLVHEGVTVGHAANVAKQDATLYYVQFDNWSGDKFTPVTGDSIILNGTVTYKDGDNITFNNITVKVTDYGYTIGDPEDITLAKNSCYIRSDAGVGNIYTVDSNDSFASFISKGPSSASVKDVTIYPAEGASYTVRSSAYVNSKDVMTIYLYDSSDNKITSLDSGTIIEFKDSKLAVYPGGTNTIKIITIKYMRAKWDGSKFTNIADEIERVTYTPSEISSFSSTYNTADIVTYTVSKATSLPVNSAWDKGWLVKDGMTVKHADGTSDTGNVWMIHNGTNTFQILWNLSWMATSQYAFKDLDEVELNFEISTTNVYEKVTAEFKNLELVYLAGTSASDSKFARADGYLGSCTYNDKNTYLDATHRAIGGSGVYIPFAENDTVGREMASWQGQSVKMNASLEYTHNSATTSTTVSILTSGSGYYIAFENWSTGLEKNIVIADGDTFTASGKFAFTYVDSETSDPKAFVIVIENLQYNVSNNLINRVVPVIDTFVADNMHMSDYTSELGYCKDTEHHYYSTAKAAFNAMDADYRKVFTNEPTYLAASNRLKAWAAANGESIKTNGDGEVVIAANAVFAGSDDNSTFASLIIIIIAITSLSYCAIYFYNSRKKKHSK